MVVGLLIVRRAEVSEDVDISGSHPDPTLR